MIEFSAKNKKLENYITEMGVTYGQGHKRDPFESFDDFQKAVYDSDIASSMDCDYDPQEAKWRKFAENSGYDGLKELANAVAKLAGTDPHAQFPGIEGLAVLTQNKALLELCDYANVGNYDIFITSMFYGGNRMKNWKKYAKPWITPQVFIDELVEAVDNLSTIDVISTVEKVGKNIVRITFGSEKAQNTPNDVNSFSAEDENKKTDHKALEAAEGLLDFSIAEKFESNVWTIAVK
jgi:hypothetical protein